MIEDLRSLPSGTTLDSFLRDSSFDLDDVYARPGPNYTFTAARRAAKHLRDDPSPDEKDFAGAIGRSLHVNDDERYQVWRDWLTAPTPPNAAGTDTREGRLQLMLLAALGIRDRPLRDRVAMFETLWGPGHLRGELVELLDVLRSRGFPATWPIDPYATVPLHAHGTYSRAEVIAAYGVIRGGRLFGVREGVMRVEDEQTDVFFVTLDKSGDNFSPTTRYNDYPISPTRFHWESQGRTAPESATGRRYIEHESRGSRVLILVRDQDDDDRQQSKPFTCLGLARYVTHQSSRPMEVIWDLERPMPPDVYNYSKVAAG